MGQFCVVCASMEAVSCQGRASRDEAHLMSLGLNMMMCLPSSKESAILRHSFRPAKHILIKWSTAAGGLSLLRAGLKPEALRHSLGSISNISADRMCWLAMMQQVKQLTIAQHLNGAPSLHALADSS